MIPAAIHLACLFPPSRGMNGDCTSIAEISHMHLPERRSAVFLALRRNAERGIANGHGNKARRREAQLASRRLAELAGRISNHPFSSKP